MATAFTAANAAATFSPPKPIGAGVRFVIWGTYNFATAIVVNDTVAICKIPANTYVIDGFLRGPDIDTGTGVLELDVGWSANGVDAANAQGFLDSGVLNGTAVANYLPAAGIRVPFQGILQSGGPKLFTVDTTVLVTATAAANAGGTGLITVMLDCFNA
jgi:hypothetical protein